MFFWNMNPAILSRIISKFCHKLHIWIASFMWQLPHLVLLIFFLKLFCGKTCITIVTFERLLSFMNWCHVSTQVGILGKDSITNSAFERLRSSMNWCYVSFQALFWSKSSITSVTLERLCSFMNLHHNCYIWNASFLHELMPCVHSSRYFVQR